MTEYSYHLSHAGLIILIYLKLQENNLTDAEICRDSLDSLNNELVNFIEKISENYYNLLPMIFSKSRLQKIRRRGRIEYSVLFSQLIRFYYEEYFNDIFASHKGGIWSSINVLRSMTPIYKNRFKLMMHSSQKVLENWVTGKNFLSFFEGDLPKDFLPESDLKVILTFSKYVEFHPLANTILSLADDVVLLNQNHISKGTKDAIRTKINQKKYAHILLPITKPLEKMLEIQDISRTSKHTASFDLTIIERHDPIEFQTVGNIISFHFYTILRFLIDENRWNAIMNEDEELKTWYEDSINTLCDFTKENLSNLEKLVGN